MRTPRYSTSPPLGLARGLREAGPEGVAALVKMLNDVNQNLKVAALDALAPEVAGKPDLVRAIKDRLRDPNAGVRAEAVRALRRSGEAPPAAVETLLRDTSPLVKAQAALSLIKTDNPDRSAAAIKELRAALADPALRVPSGPPRPLTVQVVNRSRPGRGPESPLQTLIHDVGDLGPAAAGAADALRPFRTDPDGHVREAAAEALSKIEPTATNR
jgi:HEAT repeat protein